MAARWLSVLDVEPGLGDHLTHAAREDARRRATLPVTSVMPGEWTVSVLQDTPGVEGEVLGWLTVSGLLAMEHRLGANRCLRVVAPGELVLVDDVDRRASDQWRWLAIAPAEVAILDDRLLAIGRLWPRLAAELLKLAAQQRRHSLMQQAISQLPRVEDRLLALLWSIAERVGSRTSEGVTLDLDITHETLARMVGARRPTVSMGLTRLYAEGLLAPTPRGWLLAPDIAGMSRWSVGSDDEDELPSRVTSA